MGELPALCCRLFRKKGVELKAVSEQLSREGTAGAFVDRLAAAVSQAVLANLDEDLRSDLRPVARIQ
jgi:hypothetical protein